MEPIQSINSRMIPLPYNNIDTDQIIPARYLKVTNKSGLVEGLFAGWRYQADGSLDPSFVLNNPEFARSQVLVAGDNFGCGSSREHAVWALTEWGIRAVISTSFADIFHNNALKNGLLPVIVDGETQAELFKQVDHDPKHTISIDLSAQTLTLANGRAYEFPLDSFSKYCLLNGVDQRGYLLEFEPQIAAYEQSHKQGSIIRNARNE
jgi:3-isopropylmalate/(R)-2-methylmalate dehydratase small subunit